MDLEFPDKLNVLFQPKRYKIIYGGRGSAKSWSIARALLTLGNAKPLRILCCREIQKSLKDSVHKLLSDQIDLLGLSSFYEVQDKTIRGLNGTEFIFEGLRYNVNTIKSMEGIDIVWVEEAHTVSKTSWDVLIPTIRKNGSEIWVSYNPDLETDETHKRFVIGKREDSFIVKMNYDDNPWFKQTTLLSEMEHLKKTDYNAYLNVWQGYCKQVLDGAIFAKEIIRATEQDRICKVSYDKSRPVHTAWDLGWSDATSIWFVQSVGMDFHVIDFYQNNQRDIPFYLKVLQEKGYVYGTHHLPHDASANTAASAGRSVETQIRAGGNKVKIVPRVPRKALAINAARTVFDNCYFDQEKTSDGLQCLRRYKFKVDENGQFSRDPDHDENSHAADAFMTFAWSLKHEAVLKRKPKGDVFTPRVDTNNHPQAWMG